MVTKQKVSNRKGKHNLQKTPTKVPKKVSHKVATEQVHKADRKTGASFEQSPGTQSNTLAENVALTREMEERSQNTFQTALESWQKPFGAAGQSAVTLNRKFFEIARRNIHSSFDLATGLASAKNLAEVIQLQVAYWRKLFGAFLVQTDEKRETTKTPESHKTEH